MKQKSIFYLKKKINNIKVVWLNLIKKNNSVTKQKFYLKKN